MRPFTLSAVCLACVHDYRSCAGIGTLCYCSSSPSAPFSRHMPTRGLACPAHTRLEVSLRSVGSESVWAPGVRTRCRPEPTLDCGLAFATVLPDLAFASLRLRVSSGLVCWLTPVWGWTHGHDPGVLRWAGVALASCRLWRPAFVLVSSRFLPRSWGGERQAAQRPIPPAVGQHDTW